MLPTAVRHASHAHAAQHDARHDAAHMVAGGWCPGSADQIESPREGGSNSKAPPRIWGFLVGQVGEFGERVLGRGRRRRIRGFGESRRRRSTVDHTADLFLHESTRRTHGPGGADDVPVELVGLDTWTWTG
jgi:hypothetical protein